MHSHWVSAAFLRRRWVSPMPQEEFPDTGRFQAVLRNATRADQVACLQIKRFCESFRVLGWQFFRGRTARCVRYSEQGRLFPSAAHAMDAIFKFFDRFTEMIPHSTMQMVRLGAILLWLIMGTIAIFYSWRAGSDSVPSSGQDLSQAGIREKVERERNLQNPPGLDLRSRESVVIPDTGEFRREGEPVIPYRPDGRVETRPLPNGERPKEPFSGERSSGPPYVGEDPSAYPNRGYSPPRDAGASGTRDGRAGESESRRAPLLPPPGRRSPQERAPEGNRRGQEQPDRTPAESTAPADRRTEGPRKKGPSHDPSLYPRRKSGPPALLPPGSGRSGQE